jgi:hypothetical protein
MDTLKKTQNTKNTTNTTIDEYFGFQIENNKPKINKETIKPKRNPNTKSVNVNEHILFKPSAEQQIIIDAIQRGENISVNAVAGSGKTTTILGIATQCFTKKILQITYNRALKLEVEKKAKLHKLANLKILTYHGLACSYYDYTAYTDDRIQDILRANKPLNKPETAIPFDIIIIDEIQDMTPLYFELVHKFIYDIKRKVQIGIMGDHFQGIYGFKGADERFLTLGEEIFVGHQPFTRLTLNTSYRLTQPMAHFVNRVMVGGIERINAIKDGVPVSWVQYPYEHITHYISKFIINKINSKEITAEDVFILAPSIKSSGANLIKELENALVSAGILCFVPISEEAKLDERVIKDKVVFTTMHQSKGRERKLVIVYGFDSSYYKIFKEKDIHTTTKICPNLLYVAATRASQELVIVEHIDLHQALPFLKMTHSQMGATNYVNLHQHDTMSSLRYKNIDNIRPLILADKEIPHDKSITDLIKFIDEATLAQIGFLLSQIFTTTQLPDLATTADIPSDVKTGTRTYEQVADINGITIPALLFCQRATHTTETTHTSHNSVSMTETAHTIQPVKERFDVDSRDNYLWNYLRYTLMQNKHTDKRFGFIKTYIKKLVDTWRGMIPDWLLLGNIFLSANDGYNYKLKQITNYEWLKPEQVAICHNNLLKQIPRSISQQAIYELELGDEFDGHSYYEFEHPQYNLVKLRGRLDCITPDTVWEFKCVESLSIEHMIQLVIYAWIWNRMIQETSILADKKKQQQIQTALAASNLQPDNTRSKYDAYLERTYRITRGDLYQFKKFKLMNIRNGEVRELDTTSHLINEIIEIILASKLQIRQQLTNEEFIEQQRSRIIKYIPIKYRTMDSLIEEEEANRPILDF